MIRYKKVLLALAVLFFVAVISFTTGYYFRETTQGYAVPSKNNQLNADVIFDLVNQERLKAGLKPLEWDLTLESTAYHKIQDMDTYKYFDHERDGTAIYKDIRKIKPECKTAGENLGITNDTPEAVVAGWMNSQTHKDNILDVRYDTTGISVSKTSSTYQEHYNTYKITQHFCDL